MESFCHKGLLYIKNIPHLELVRYRRVNVQRPAKPHYEKAKVLAVCEPRYPKFNYGLSLEVTCRKQTELKSKKIKEENPYELIIAKECLHWFNKSKMVAFFHANPIKGEDQFKARVMFHKHNMAIKQYGPNVIKYALENTKYSAVLPLFQSRTAVVFSPELQLAQLLKISKRIPQLILMTCIAEDRLLSRNEIVMYSNLPDLTTARAGLVATLNSAVSQVLSNITHHQRTLVSHLQKHAELLQKPEET
ncbi:39S ribosomal protein L10, mitochondrial [Schistocerca piceifrons]|uniref:39S ribosomal protein L10, mitochondrial n=1 Tax=Schistocerca piceifrons TaxID=274613 RepID=UPI001F5E7B04|nr:39S ribosomal protein L10, mitochondrial [Schistocerca piceifrons]